MAEPSTPAWKVDVVDRASPASSWNRVRLAVGSVGLWLAAIATAIGVSGCAVAWLAAQEFLASEEIETSQLEELQVLALHRSGRQLLRVVAATAEGDAAAAGGLPAAWQDFEQALAKACSLFAASIATAPALRVACDDANGLHAQLAPAGLHDPAVGHALAPDLQRRLQALESDIETLSELVLMRSRSAEDLLAERYRLGLFLLGGSAATAVLLALLLVYFLNRAAVRYDAKARELALQHARLDSIVELSGAPILLVDGNLQIVLGNREFHRLGLVPDAMPSNPFNLDLAQLARWRKRPTGVDHHGPVAYASELIDGAGHRRLLNVTATPLVGGDGALQGIVFVAVDDTERWQAQQALIQRARYDRLTGLASRSHFIEATQSAIEEAARRGRGFAVLCLDIDDFQDINSTMGYAVGDGLLEAVARRVGRRLRDGEMAARLGADEFAVLHLDVPDEAAAERLARELLDSLRKPYDLGGTPVRSTASIGVSVHGPEPVAIEIAVAQADMALQRGKARGRNGYSVFTAEIDREVRSRAWLAQEMSRGLAAGQFSLQYQPRVDVERRRVTGVEALLRWRHPEQGMLSPAVFIPIAESTGLIRELGRWALSEACRQGGEWKKAGLDVGRIAVNVSTLQFEDSAELEQVLWSSLAAAGLGPESLEIEVTETVLIGVSREHGNFLERLRQRGVAVAVDDFGTGYSSLQYLRRLPVDRLKIAQEFVQGMAADQGHRTITRTIVRLARGLRARGGGRRRGDRRAAGDFASLGLPRGPGLPVRPADAGRGDRRLPRRRPAGPSAARRRLTARRTGCLMLPFALSGDRLAVQEDPGRRRSRADRGPCRRGGGRAGDPGRRRPGLHQRHRA